MWESPSVRELEGKIVVLLLRPRSSNDIINGPIRDVFLKYAADLTLCLYLLQRHHTVSADEAVVKVEGTAHLIDDRAVKNIVS